MNPEVVYSLLTEKSNNPIAIRGGIPVFTSDDAAHCLGGLKPAEFLYCEYVFLLHDSRLDDLTQDVCCYIKNEHPEFYSKARPQVLKHLIKIAIVIQRVPEGKVPDAEIYRLCQLSRGEWRYHWKDIYVEMLNYLNHLRIEIANHIRRRTKEG